MSRADFDRFVRRKQEEKAEAASFDPEQEIADWRDYLDALYEQIGTFLQPYIEAGSARVDFQPVQINEDFSGPYESKTMLLHIGASTIVFEPIGTMLIGSKGRVDVHGPRGTARLSLINKEVTHARQAIQVSLARPGDRRPEPARKPEIIEWVWKIITPAPEMKFIELDEDSFFDMILGVADA